MRRLAPSLMLLVGMLLMGLAAPAGATSPSAPLRLTEAGGTRFPDRAFVLSVPRQAALSARTIRVLEDGQPVAGVSVTAAGAAGARQFGVVLVIDASLSTRGEPIAAAMAAARGFAATRTAGQQLGVVAFNDRPLLTLPLTTDRTAIAHALAVAPPLGRGTHIYDAVGRAVDLLRAAQVSAGSVVLISDGSDTGSSATEADVARAAASAHVRIFSIGLRSRAFDPDTLRALAVAAGGHYTEASSTASLARIYRELGTQLANEFLIRYRSHAAAGRLVHVALDAGPALGSAMTAYRTPALPASARAARPATGLHGFWASSAAIVGVSLTCALLLGLALGVALTHRRRRRALHGRIDGFAAGDEEPQPQQQRPQHVATGSVVAEGGDRSPLALPRWEAFEELLALARIEQSATQIAGWTAAATVLLGLALVAATGKLPAALLALVVPFAVRAFVLARFERQARLFAEQLPDALQVVASALRAGHSFVGALAVLVEDAGEPTRTEFGRVVADDQLGRPLQASLDEVARRMRNDDLGQVAVVAGLQRETGGNSAEVVDRVTATVRERADLRRLVDTLTAQGRLTRWIVTALPVVLAIAVSTVNPRYMQPLYGTGSGRLLLAAAVVMVVVGSLAIKRIVNIKI